MSFVHIVLIKSELGASKRGAALGPDSVIKAASDKGNNLFSRYSLSLIEPPGTEVSAIEDGKWAKNINQIIQISEELAKVVQRVAANKQFLLLLSGDHSTAAGSIAGLKLAFPEERIGVIWIDAHADLHSPYTTPSGNLHGMPLAVSLGLDNLHLQHNQPDDETVRAWELFKNLGNISPKMKPEDLVYIGLRQMEAEEEKVIGELQIPFITVGELRLKGVDKTASKALTLLSHCQHILLSFDVDSLDPSVSVATGTPVEGGFTKTEALSLLKTLCADQRVKCLEIVEINPEMEPGNAMGEIAFEITDCITEIVNKQANHAY
jgi:arginase